MFYVFDIGGTKMRLAYSFDGENIQETKFFSTPQDFNNALEIIKNFYVESAKTGNGNSKVVCGLPGVFDRGKTFLAKAPNLPYWVGIQIKNELEKVTEAEVFLENDAALGGLGEATFGEGKGSSIVAFITIGTGVGGVRIVNGKIDKSVFGFEPGHQIINADVVVGGKMVDLEGVVSGIGILTRYGKKAEDIKDIDTWAEIEKFLSIGLTNTILHWSPDVVILGGGLIQNDFISIERIQIEVSKLLTVFPKIPEIRKGILGDEAGLRGGLVYLKDDIRA